MVSSTEKSAYLAIKKFQIIGQPKEICRYGNGHINDTYLVIMKEKGIRYILQRINKHVFAHPDEVIENIAGVTAYIRKEVEKLGGDVNREVLNLIPTVDGSNFYFDEDEQYWRVYLFVERTNTFQLPDTPAIFYESARAFGNFGALLADYPCEKLNVTIPGFHDTPWRYKQLRHALKDDVRARAKEVERELEFVFEHEKEASILREMKENGELPIRVTHNDTKLNNVLFDDKTDKGVCVIDLDTIMPGLSVYDFGDAIRFGANTSEEDEEDLDKCELSLPMFRAYTEGYLECAKDALTEKEITMLPEGAKIMTLECGIRFLTDYINGDIYFRVHYEKQNLRRARNQFKLVSSMEEKWQDMCAIVENTI
ncbi:MAG: aminoglycoside phosphotransferase family protein [Clostridiales bacterium]|nr:aminoglycoside phosphotransferase family protein [Clostridiales bacterium]